MRYSHFGIAPFTIALSLAFPTATAIAVEPDSNVESRGITHTADTALPRAGKGQLWETGPAVSLAELNAPRPAGSVDVNDQPEADRNRSETRNKPGNAEYDPLNRLILKTDADGTIVERYLVSPKQENVQGNPSGEQFMWSAGSHEAVFDWPNIDNRPQWTAYRNGKKAATTRESQYIDETVDRSKPNVYTFISDTVEKDGEQTQHIYGVTIPPANDASIGLNINNPEVRSAQHNTDVFEPRISSEKSADGSAQLLYSTFIPEKSVEKPPACGGEFDSYAGDNRTFRTRDVGLGEASSRGENHGNVTVINGKTHTDYIDHKVGETQALKDGKIVERKTADKSGLNTTVSGSTIAVVRFTQNIANPLCNQAPAINVDVTASYDPGGRMRVTGKHDGAPNRELVYQTTSSKGRSSGCAYRYEYDSFLGLLPPMGVNVELDVSVNTGSHWPMDCAIHKNR